MLELLKERKREKMKVCSTCGKVILGSYFKCNDEVLKIAYFESEEENIFCSSECFCEYLMLEECEKGKENYNVYS